MMTYLVGYYLSDLTINHPILRRHMDAQVAGGGRSSARETIGRVAAGAVAKKLLHLIAGVEVSLSV